MELQRWKMAVAYDGRQLQGWQSQPSALTVQDLLERAFREICQKEIRIHGSGRTDAGVHANEQIFHVDIAGNLRISEGKWPIALNTRLPKCVRVLSAQKVDDSFHARFSALGKIYRYRIVTSQIQLPRDDGWCWHHPQKISLEKISQGLSFLQGKHDFHAFAAKRGNEPAELPEDYFIREIYSAKLDLREDEIWLTFCGNGFLYKMVRLLVGGLICLGREKISVSEFQALFDPNCSKKSPLCAPSEGLYLHKVLYDK